MKKPNRDKTLIFRWKFGWAGIKKCTFTHKDERDIEVLECDDGSYVVSIRPSHTIDYHKFDYIEDVRDFLLGIVKEKKRWRNLT